MYPVKIIVISTLHDCSSIPTLRVKAKVTDTDRGGKTADLNNLL